MPLNTHRTRHQVLATRAAAGIPLTGRAGRTMVRYAMLACLVLASIPHTTCAKDYGTYDEAMADAQKAINAKNYLASEEPLEAAFKLAEDDLTRIKVYRLLFDAYQLHPEIDDMLRACEFVLDHSQSAAEKSLVRTDLLNFVSKKEKTDLLIEHFAKRLENNDSDQTALFVLSETYTSLKDDPEKGAGYLEQLIKAIEASGEEVDVLTHGQLASLYVKSKQYQKGAELFEKIAPTDETMAPWHWKEAAAAWQKAGEKDKALNAAMTATKVGPETRAGMLNYYWNNTLGDVYLDCENPKLAIDHYEAALKSTKLPKYYVSKTTESLEKARKLSK